MRPIVTDTYDFPTIVEEGCVYVDKTALLQRLVSGVDGTQFFICRPRRFGKSAKVALKQCRDRKYALPYADDQREVVLVGVNYGCKAGTIEIEIGEVSGEVNPKRGEVNGEVKSYIAEHPGCRRKDILSEIRLAPRTLDRQLAKLSEFDEIEFRGAPKTGGYYVIEEYR